MVHLLLLLLASQPLAALPDDPPVRIWLGSGPSLASGDQAQVYVQTTTEGHLVLLHALSDGRVEVLFPADPMRDPFVNAGTYEVPFVASGPEGRGMLVAALSPDPIWFDEFIHRSMWDVATLTSAGTGADPEAVLTDVVQRMLGDGSFTYDLVTYYVVPPPPPVAAAPAPIVESASGCIDCYYPGTGYIIYGSAAFYPYSHRRWMRGAVPWVPRAFRDPPAIAAYSAHRSNPLAPLSMRRRETAPPQGLVAAAAPTWRRRIPAGAAAALPTTSAARRRIPAGGAVPVPMTSATRRGIPAGGAVDAPTPSTARRRIPVGAAPRRGIPAGAVAAVPTAATVRAVPLVAGSRSTAARPTAAARSQLAVRYIRPPRNPSAALAPMNAPGTSGIPVVPARGFTRAAASPAIPALAVPAAAPARPMPPAPRFATRSGVWRAIPRAGVMAAAPAAASAGSATGVGLQAVGTAGWRR